GVIVALASDHKPQPFVLVGTEARAAVNVDDQAPTILHRHDLPLHVRRTLHFVPLDDLGAFALALAKDADDLAAVAIRKGRAGHRQLGLDADAGAVSDKRVAGPDRETVDLRSLV